MRSPDTDVLVILISYAASISQPLFLDTGTGNKRRLIDIKAIACSLGTELSVALPAYHAFSGCDYTSAFVRRGKVKPFKILQNRPESIEIFTRLGASRHIDDTTLKGLEQFVCSMYGHATYQDVDKLRHQIFQSRYDVSTNTSALNIKTGVDMSMLPPCKSSLQLHCQRSNYVAYVWKNSHVSHPDIPAPIGFGWELDENGLIKVQWTQGDILPQNLVNVLSSDSSSTQEAGSDEMEDM